MAGCISLHGFVLTSPPRILAFPNFNFHSPLLSYWISLRDAFIDRGNAVADMLLLGNIYNSPNHLLAEEVKVFELWMLSFYVPFVNSRQIMAHFVEGKNERLSSEMFLSNQLKIITVCLCSSHLWNWKYRGFTHGDFLSCKIEEVYFPCRCWLALCFWKPKFWVYEVKTLQFWTEACWISCKNYLVINCVRKQVSACCSCTAGISIMLSLELVVALDTDK